MYLINISDNHKLTFYQLKSSKHNLINCCYFIVNEKNRNAIAIDPAWDTNKFETIIDHHKIDTISVLLTHHHKDHIDLAEFFALKYNSNIYMSAKEIAYYGYHCKNLLPIESESAFILGGIKVIPILTPGHTVGSTCYLIEKHLYTGDTLFIEGCGMCTGKGGNPEAMFDSLNRLKKILALDDRIYPGHHYHAEPGQSFSYLLQSNIYLHFNDKEQFIKFRMREGQKGLFAFR